MLWDIVLIVGILLMALSLRKIFVNCDTDSASFLDYFYLGYHYYEAPYFAHIPFACCIFAEIFYCIRFLLLYGWTKWTFLLIFIVIDVVFNMFYFLFTFGRVAEPIGPVKRFFENQKHYEKRAARCYGVSLEEFEALEEERKIKEKKLKEVLE